jgi:hypothetical protein
MRRPKSRKVADLDAATWWQRRERVACHPSLMVPNRQPTYAPAALRWVDFGDQFGIHSQPHVCEGGAGPIRAVGVSNCDGTRPMPSRVLTTNRHPTTLPRTPTMNRYLPALVIVLLSTGCGSNKGGIASSGSMSTTSEKPETIERGGGGGAPTSEGQSGASLPADPISYLAYAYGIRLELPGDRLISVMDGHAAACRDAGLRVAARPARSRSRGSCHPERSKQ